MRTVATFSVVLIFSSGLFAQKGFVGSTQPVLRGGFGSAVFPGGTSATVPGINRNVSPFVSPLGGPRLVVPTFNNGFRNGFNNGFNNGFRNGGRNNSTVYYYPLFVGGGYGGYPYGYPGYGYGDVPPDAMAPPQQQQPNITVVYPPQSAPVIMSPYGPTDNSGAPTPRMYNVPQAPAPDDTATVNPPEPSHYLIAFKDHTIYSATNYWVQGDTLHYFTTGNTHNQVSLSLVDRDLTLRLNKESGTPMDLPVPKE